MTGFRGQLFDQKCSYHGETSWFLGKALHPSFISLNFFFGYAACFHSASLDNASGPYAHSWRLFLPQHDHSVIAEPVHPIQPPYHRGHLHQHSPASRLSFESTSRPHHGKNANAPSTEPAPHTLGLGLHWSRNNQQPIHVSLP